MKNKRKTLFRLIAVAVTILFIGVQVVSIAQATPLGQDPRPPAEPGDGGSGGGGNNGGGAGGGGGGTSTVGTPGSGSSISSVPGCTSVAGQVINWGFGPEANVGVELKTGSWRASTASSSDGNYGLGGLGEGVAVLDVSLAPGLSEQLQPRVQNAGVYLTCQYSVIANLAISGAEIEPPASIEMSAPNRLTSGSKTPIRLTVENGLPNEITNVIVTDLMPPGLIALEVKAAAVNPSNARIIDAGKDGQLVAVFLDKLAAGAEANIFITVTPAAGLPPDTQIRNAATLFYRESAADQAWLDFTVNGNELSVPTAAAIMGGGDQDSTVVGETSSSGAGEESVAPSDAPKTGGELISTPDDADTVDSFVPPDNMPTTGGEFVSIDTGSVTDGSYLLFDDKPAVNEAAVGGTDFPLITTNRAENADVFSMEKTDDRLPPLETDNGVERPIAPITGISGVLLIITLGLAGLGFWTKRSPLDCEQQQ